MGAQGLRREIAPGVRRGGGWTSLTTLSPLPPPAPPPARGGSRGCRCIMPSLGVLGSARSGLGLLLGTAAGLGFLYALYRQRWKRTQRHGQNQLLPNSLDVTQTSEPRRQGRSRSSEATVTAKGWVWDPACLSRAYGTGRRRRVPERFTLLESLLKRKAFSLFPSTLSPVIPGQYIVKGCLAFTFGFGHSAAISIYI